jgi:hypothetical protein
MAAASRCNAKRGANIASASLIMLIILLKT